jgi:hypothetical protein
MHTANTNTKKRKKKATSESHAEAAQACISDHQHQPPPMAAPGLWEKCFNNDAFNKGTTHKRRRRLIQTILGFHPEEEVRGNSRQCLQQGYGVEHHHCQVKPRVFTPELETLCSVAPLNLSHHVLPPPLSMLKSPLRTRLPCFDSYTRPQP